MTSQTRGLLAGILLAAVPAVAALVARKTEKPWIPQAPDYRHAGAPDAPAVLVEFGDFQCPPCGYAAPIVKKMESDYGEKLHVVFKHRPWLEMHKWAKASALAAECAGKQGKFWPMYDLLFSKQAEWSRPPQAAGNSAEREDTRDVPKILEGYAQSMGLDMKAYRQCVADPATFALIEADVKDAQDHFINSTPTFFVDGRRLVGGNQLKVLGANEIERRLGR